jgi:hypothetical protein
MYRFARELGDNGLASFTEVLQRLGLRASKATGGVKASVCSDLVRCDDGD